MADLSTEHYHQKNTFGLPTEAGTDSGTVLDREEEVTQEAEEALEASTQEEEVIEQESEGEEVAEEEEEVDFSPEAVVERLSTATQSESVEEEESELSKLRRENAVLSAIAEERKATASARIAEQVPVEEETDNYLDFTDTRVVDKWREYIDQDPVKAMMLMQAMAKQEAQKLVKETVQPLQDTVKQREEYQKQIDLGRKVATTIDTALADARKLGEVEEALVKQAETYNSEGRLQESLIYKEIAKRPDLVQNKAELVQAIVTMARQAVAPKGQHPAASAIPRSESPNASTRSGDMLREEQGNPDEADEMLNQIKSASRRSEVINDLLSP